MNADSTKCLKFQNPNCKKGFESREDTNPCTKYEDKNCIECYSNNKVYSILNK